MKLGTSITYVNKPLYGLLRIFALTISIIGLIVVIGWISDIKTLQSLLPNWVTMKFSTAISFVMTGIILYLMNEAKHSNSELAKILIPAPIIVITFYMFTLFVSNIAGISTGIENLFIQEKSDAVATTEPGRPSVLTMFSFILLVLSSLFSLINKEKHSEIFVIGLMISVISGIAMIGYATNISVLYYQINNFSTAMALHTAMTFMLIGITLMLFRKLEHSSSDHKRISIRTKVLVTLLAGILPTLFFVSILSYLHGEFVHTLPQVVTIGSFVIIASLFIVKIILTPIIKLKHASMEIEKGNFDIQLPKVPNDEIGDLTSHFQHMNESIKSHTIELKKANEDLHKIGRQKEEFSSMVVHELRSSLVPIKGYVDLLLSGNLGVVNEKQKEKLMIIRKTSESLQRLISDVLDVQKLEIGVLKLHLTENDLSDLINEVLIKLRPELEKQGITVTSSLIQNVKCVCDKERIEQVFVNLLNNSIDFCPKSDGKIDICLTIEDDYAKISIADNGVGIPEDKLEKIFIKFYQIDSSLTREYGGTGVGLSICKGIIDQHGGKIWAQSMIGRGATFNILLPKNHMINRLTTNLNPKHMIKA